MVSIHYTSGGSVAVRENGKMITQGDSYQHFAFAKNVFNTLEGRGVKASQMDTTKGRTITFEA